MVVGVKADYRTRDLGLWVDCPPWGVFLREPSPYLRKILYVQLMMIFRKLNINKILIGKIFNVLRPEES